MKTIWLVAVAFSMVPFLSGADDKVAGQKGEWSVRSHGVSTDLALRASGAASQVAQAFDAAWKGKKNSFADFWNFDTNQPSPRIEALYKEWNSLGERYVFLISEEATLGNEKTSSNLCSAISIVPTMALGRPPVQGITNEPVLEPRVVFAENRKGVWRLLPETQDKVVEQTLLSRAAKFLHRPTYSKEEADARLRKFRQDYLEIMRSNGASPARITSQKERIRVEEADIRLDNWAAWTNYYHAVVLDSPVAFNKKEPFAYDYLTPLSALRSYLRAFWTGDAKALLQHADASGQSFLKKIGVNEAEPRSTYDIPSMTLITPLLTAETSLEGKDYVLVFWRAQNDMNPKNGSIALQNTIFVRNGGEYFMTRDLEASYLEDILRAGQLKGGGIWKYPDFEKKMKESTFPPHFYAIP